MNYNHQEFVDSLKNRVNKGSNAPYDVTVDELGPDLVYVVELFPDYDVDLSWDDDKETVRLTESGLIYWYGMVCTLYYQGLELGEDSLWGIWYNHSTNETVKASKKYLDDLTKNSLEVIKSQLADNIKSEIDDMSEKIEILKSFEYEDKS